MKSVSLPIAVLALVMFTAQTVVNAAIVLDNFSTNKHDGSPSDPYTYFQAFGGPTADSWAVSGGTMNPSNVGTTDGWFWENNSMAPGDAVSVDVRVLVLDFREGGFRLAESLNYADNGRVFAIAYRNVPTAGWYLDLDGAYIPLTGTQTDASTLTLTRGEDANQNVITWEVTGGGLSGSGMYNYTGLLESEDLNFGMQAYLSSGNVHFDNLIHYAAPVPEPSTAAMLSLAWAGFAARRRRKK